MLNKLKQTRLSKIIMKLKQFANWWIIMFVFLFENSANYSLEISW